MSDLAATNCGCGCEDTCQGGCGCGDRGCGVRPDCGCGFGGNSCGSLIWILILLCCCGNGGFGSDPRLFSFIPPDALIYLRLLLSHSLFGRIFFLFCTLQVNFIQSVIFYNKLCFVCIHR